MKVLIGIMIGGFLVCILGAIQLADRLVLSGAVDVSGAFDKLGIYTPVFSGMTPDGECLLAITNSTNGNTEIFKITKETQMKMSGITPFQGTGQKTMFIKLRPQP